MPVMGSALLYRRNSEQGILSKDMLPHKLGENRGRRDVAKVVDQQYDCTPHGQGRHAIASVSRSYVLGEIGPDGLAGCSAINLGNLMRL
jgi:hypothetical protein